MRDNRLIERKRVFEGRVFNLDAVTLREEDGRTVDRQVVVHRGAVVVLPVLNDGRVVMIRNERFAVGKRLWELCAGTLEEGEEPAKCAARELVEETGYEAEKIERLCGFYSCPGFCTEYLHCFLATQLRQVGQSLDETEDIAVEPLRVDEVMAMVQDGRIEDAKTIATLLYWRQFLRREAPI